MIHKTIWRPDTCDCEIEYEWDDSLPVEVRVHTVSRIITRCQYHNENTKENHFNKVLEENQRKNKVWGKLIEDDSLVDLTLDEEGNTVRKLKPSIKYDWQFDGNRNLVVKMPKLSTKQKNDFKSKTTEFGNKVVII